MGEAQKNTSFSEITSLSASPSTGDSFWPQTLRNIPFQTVRRESGATLFILAGLGCENVLCFFNRRVVSGA